jgi:hypothetical protein
MLVKKSKIVMLGVLTICLFALPVLLTGCFGGDGDGNDQGYTVPSQRNATYGQNLTSVSLPDGWEWVSPNDRTSPWGVSGIRAHQARTHVGGDAIVRNVNVNVVHSGTVNAPTISRSGQHIVLIQNPVTYAATHFRIYINSEYFTTVPRTTTSTSFNAQGAPGGTEVVVQARAIVSGGAILSSGLSNTISASTTVS